MKKFLLLAVLIHHFGILLAQNSGYSTFMAQADPDGISLKDAGDSFGPGLVIFLVGLVISLLFKNNNPGQKAGYFIMAIGAFLGLGGFLIIILKGIGRLIAIGLIVIAAYYFLSDLKESK